MVGVDDPPLTAEQAGQLVMMMQMILVGVGAGLATALLFASVASGALISIPLFYLSPLPILIAALGWSHWSALIAAVIAGGGLALFLGGYFFVAFLIGIGLPAWWLGYLALLARPAANPADGMEWYPPGQLVVWAGFLGAGVVIAAIPTFGFDEESYRAGLRGVFERMLKTPGRTGVDSPFQVPGFDPKKFVDFLVVVIPLAGAALASLTSTLNLWLAARAVRLSGRLKRPWPDLPGMQFPAFVPATLAVAIGVSFLSGLAGIVGGIVSVGLLTAYLVLGFAVLHSITRNAGGRSILIGTSYGAVFILGWPALLIMMLGLADSIFNLRGRIGNGRPPALPTR